MREIILASTSPRRKEILEKTGLNFKAVDSGYDEDMSLDLKPDELAKYLAKGKVLALKNIYNNHIIIGADTFVVSQGKLLGKAKDKKEVGIMLNEINGKELSVITGFVIIDTIKDKIISESVETKLKIKNLTQTQIQSYTDSGEGIGKAGGFAVQGLGSVIIERIEGDFFNVMGLPISTLTDKLREFDIKVL